MARETRRSRAEPTNYTCSRVVKEGIADNWNVELSECYPCPESVIEDVGRGGSFWILLAEDEAHCPTGAGASMLPVGSRGYRIVAESASRVAVDDIFEQGGLRGLVRGSLGMMPGEVMRSMFPGARVTNEVPAGWVVEKDRVRRSWLRILGQGVAGLLLIAVSAFGPPVLRASLGQKE